MKSLLTHNIAGSTAAGFFTLPSSSCGWRRLLPAVAVSAHNAFRYAPSFFAAGTGSGPVSARSFAGRVYA